MLYKLTRKDTGPLPNHKPVQYRTLAAAYQTAQETADHHKMTVIIWPSEMPQKAFLINPRNDPDAFIPLALGLVTDLRFLGAAELKTAAGIDDSDTSEFGWSHIPVALVFESGALLYCQADDEGNNGGAVWRGGSPLHPADSRQRKAVLGCYIAAVKGDWTTCKVHLTNLVTGKTTILFPMRDAEGNGPGVFAIMPPDGDIFGL